MNNMEEYTTSDLPLIATLFYTGFPIKEIDKKNPKRKKFTFTSPNNDNVAISAIIGHYYTGTLSNFYKIEPNEFYESIKKVKHMLNE